MDAATPSITSSVSVFKRSGRLMVMRHALFFRVQTYRLTLADLLRRIGVAVEKSLASGRALCLPRSTSLS